MYTFVGVVKRFFMQLEADLQHFHRTKREFRLTQDSFGVLDQGSLLSPIPSIVVRNRCREGWGIGAGETALLVQLREQLRTPYVA